MILFPIPTPPQGWTTYDCHREYDPRNKSSSGSLICSGGAYLMAGMLRNRRRMHLHVLFFFYENNFGKLTIWYISGLSNTLSIPSLLLIAFTTYIALLCRLKSIIAETNFEVKYWTAHHMSSLKMTVTVPGSELSADALFPFFFWKGDSCYCPSLAKTVHQEGEEGGDIGFPVAWEMPGKSTNGLRKTDIDTVMMIWNVQ